MHQSIINLCGEWETSKYGCTLYYNVCASDNGHIPYDDENNWFSEQEALKANANVWNMWMDGSKPCFQKEGEDVVYAEAQELCLLKYLEYVEPQEPAVDDRVKKLEAASGWTEDDGWWYSNKTDGMFVDLDGACKIQFDNAPVWFQHPTDKYYWPKGGKKSQPNRPEEQNVVIVQWYPYDETDERRRLAAPPIRRRRLNTLERVFEKILPKRKD